MKRFITVLMLTILTATAVLCAGCSATSDSTPDGTITNGHTLAFAFTVDDGFALTDSTTMYDCMVKLKEDGTLTFEATDGSYGVFLTSVFGVGGKTVSSTANSYSGWDWAVYTTLTSLDGVIYAGETTYILDGVTFYKSSYGVSSLPSIKGESYALIYEFSTMSW